MSLTPELVKLFEQDQKDHGTEVALFNHRVMIAQDILKGAGAYHLTVDEEAHVTADGTPKKGKD